MIEISLGVLLFRRLTYCVRRPFTDIFSAIDAALSELGDSTLVLAFCCSALAWIIFTIAAVSSLP
jgi:hypothetical protein